MCAFIVDINDFEEPEGTVLIIWVPEGVMRVMTVLYVISLDS